MKPIIKIPVASSVVFVMFLMIAVTKTQSQEQDVFPVLKGKVINVSGQPVARAKIVMTDDDTGEQTRSSSDSKGRFFLSHSACKSLSFMIIPPDKTGFAQAQFLHLSGDSTKQFIVKLLSGFKVCGHVYGGTKLSTGLKGVEVKFSAASTDNSKDYDAHDGGTVTTGKDGRFQLLLTPGRKLLEITNDQYSEFASLYKTTVTVTADTNLPDIYLPKN